MNPEKANHIQTTALWCEPSDTSLKGWQSTSSSCRYLGKTKWHFMWSWPTSLNWNFHLRYLDFTIGNLTDILDPETSCPSKITDNQFLCLLKFSPVRRIWKIPRSQTVGNILWQKSLLPKNMEHFSPVWVKKEPVFHGKSSSRPLIRPLKSHT